VYVPEVPTPLRPIEGVGGARQRRSFDAVKATRWAMVALGLAFWLVAIA
jgi:hypothetical protein